MLKPVSLLVLAALPALAPAQPLSTAFTFQGSLGDSGAPASGTFDFRFRLYDAPAAGTQLGSTLCADDTAVAAGQFSIAIDFGPQFNGNRRWLEIEVRPDTGQGCADPAGFTVLSPRQEIQAVPYAQYSLQSATTSQLNGQPASFYTNASNLTSGSLPNARLSGTYTGVVGFTNASNTIAGSGAGLTALNAGNLASGAVPNARLSGTYSGVLSLTNASNTLAGNGSALTSLNASNIASGVLAAARLPSDWAAGGDLTGFYPSPTIAAGAVDVAELSPGLSAMIDRIPSQTTIPVFRSEVALPVGTKHVALNATWLYVSNSTANTLTPVDVSNPLVPAIAASTSVAGGPSAIVGGALCVASLTSPTLRVFQLSTPSSPTLVGSIAISGTPRNVMVSGTNAIVVTSTGNLQVFSIANPAVPSLIGSLAVGGAPASAAIAGSLVCVSYTPPATPFLRVVDVSVPATPVLRGSSSVSPADPGQLFAAGNFVYSMSTSTSSMAVFDLSNPASPQGSFVDMGTYLLMTTAAPVQGQFIMPMFPTELAIVGLADPSRPTLQATVTGGTSGNYGPIAAGPTRLCTVSTADVGLRVYELVNASALNSPLLAPAGIVGDGSQLANLNAARLSSGTISTSRLPTSVVRTDASATFAARPAFDGGASGATPPFTVDSTFLVSNLNADLLDGLSSAAFAGATHSHAASDISSGLLADARIPANIPRLDASGLLADARLSANIPRLDAVSNFFANDLGTGNDAYIGRLLTVGEDLTAGTRLRVYGSEVNDPQWSTPPLAVFSDGTRPEISFVSFAAVPRVISFRSEEDTGFGAITFTDVAGLGFFANSGSTPALSITPTNRIGVGTTAPQGRIGIQSVGASDSTNLLTFSEDNTAEFYFESGFAATGANGNHLKLKTSWGNNPMTWFGNGNVGIGTIAPDFPLHVRAADAVMALDSDAAGDTWTNFQENGTLRAAIGYVKSNASRQGLNLFVNGQDRLTIKDNGDINFPAKTRYLSLAPGSFQVPNALRIFSGFIIHDALVVGQYGQACAYPQLPHGAVITALRVYCDDTANTNLTCELLVTALDGTSVPQVAASASSSGTSGMQTPTDTTISFATVDNATKYYVVQVSWNKEASGSISVYGVRIDYTVTAPLP